MSTLSIALCASTALGQDVVQAQSDYFTAGQDLLAERVAAQPNTNQAMNVILFVADGMGIGTNYGIRVFQGQEMGLLGEEHNLPYDLYPHSAIIKTYNINAQTPDSAPTAGAMNTGVKQVFNTINMADTVVHNDCSTEAPLTLFSELVSEAGKSVGVVSTARITHATGAAVYAKTANRNWENNAPEGCTDIATQLIDQMEAGVIDIALGGGARSFAPEGTELEVGTGNRPDDVNLIDRAAEIGAQVVYNSEDLAAADLSAPVLGLFTNSDMNYEHDRPEGEPSLADMTTAAIESLQGDEDGFYLMVEAGRVDHASHGGNAHRAFTDGVALAEAVAAAQEMVDLENTLIIVTADHEHVMSFNGYCGRGTPITGLCMGVAAGQVEHSGEPVTAADGKPYTVVSYTNGAGSVLIEQEDGTYSGERPDLTQEEAQDPDYLQQALIPMGSETHSGVDVGLWANGPWSHLFGGTMDQEMIFHVMNHAVFGAAE
ncbi:alkaline phosphatase [Pelagibacterium halotolerans]|uniref:Alkaline phosphatase n=1 Tax=Pelagibacterium halotolerans (strain DSM 22347 / JCM 15775 / CGMCC 1.7692 / B2) TaxID=1082931 RepID=G4RDA6_PELHB|nr:alkaline phosphatase [Pelagibacterium halotolerans]AEQ50732.1 alkaline phosphatase [Pelagibacterium halotolerans B2]